MRVRILSATIVLLFLVVSSAAVSKPSIITVEGTDNSLVDRPAVQAALDAAKPGDTVELLGTFQLDGTWLIIKDSRLTIEGRAIDNDGDGRVNEDPVDYVDNDGDGEVDEDDWDAVLNGIANDVDGSPMLDFTAADLFNRGLVVDASNGTLRQITVRNIKFSTFNRAVSFSPEFAPTSNVCEDILSAPRGSASGITVEGNWVDNSFRGIQFFNDVRDFTVTGNLVTGSEQNGVLLVGELQGCTWSNGDEGTVPIASPENGRIFGNTIVGGVYNLNEELIGRGVNVIGGRVIAVNDNRISESRHGVRVERGSRIHTHHNWIAYIWTNGLLGIEGSPRSSFANNTVRNAYRGVGLHRSATGYTVVNNDTEVFDVDVFLSETSFENKVIATDFATSVTDLGTDNKLVGTLAPIHNSGAPDDVRAKLEEHRAQLAEKMQ